MLISFLENLLIVLYWIVLIVLNWIIIYYQHVGPAMAFAFTASALVICIFISLT